MTNTPVYGFEEFYLAGVNNEITPDTRKTYTDSFGNLIAQKGDEETILLGIAASENACMVTEITSDGYAKITPLKELDKEITNHKIVINKKSGFICGDKNNYKIDFGFKSEEAVSKIVKVGDTAYIKPVVENVGDAYFTNAKCYLLKEILVDIIKKSNSNVTYAFIREDKKGAYALGKNLKIQQAYFIEIIENLKEPACFIRKEGDFISDMRVFPTAVLEKETTLANAYYSGGGSKNTTGVGLRGVKLENGYIKVYKEDIDVLTKMLGVI